MNVISIITAVDPARADYLPETWASLVAQDMPPGWHREWLVQCDSLDESAQAAVRAVLPDEYWVSFGASRKGGPGVARNMALARASGKIVKTLDADDRLAPGALDRDIHAITLNRVGWVTSRVLDDMDGTFAPHYNIPIDPSPGRIRSGSAYAAYRDDYRMLVHPATLCVDYSLLVALGGWMALPASEDTGLLLALDAVSDGWFNSIPGLYYRRWSEQMSSDAAHTEPAELDARRSLITTRAEALSLLLT